MLLMVLGSIAISFGGLVQRNIEVADPWQINFYRSLGILLAAAEVTLIMLIEFALGPIWVWLFIGEVPTRWTIFGGSLIICAVAVRAILELINKPRPEQTPSLPLSRSYSLILS